VEVEVYCNLNVGKRLAYGNPRFSMFGRGTTWYYSYILTLDFKDIILTTSPISITIQLIEQYMICASCRLFRLHSVSSEILISSHNIFRSVKSWSNSVIYIHTREQIEVSIPRARPSYFCLPLGNTDTNNGCFW